MNSERTPLAGAFVIRSEFAVVAVSKDSEANGDRLRIQNLRSGHVFFLDPLELERIAAARHEDLAAIVSPDADEVRAMRRAGEGNGSVRVMKAKRQPQRRARKSAKR